MWDKYMLHYIEFIIQKNDKRLCINVTVVQMADSRQLLLSYFFPKNKHITFRKENEKL